MTDLDQIEFLMLSNIVDAARQDVEYAMARLAHVEKRQRNFLDRLNARQQRAARQQDNTSAA